MENTLASKLAKGDRGIRAIYVGTYIPRECGIATFTKDLTTAINVLNPFYLAEIIAIDEPGALKRKYPWEVKYRIEQENLDSYLSAADYINQSSTEVVCLQHEFGIYGGRCGDFVIPFLEKIKKPKIVTLHTVLSKPLDYQKYIIKELAKKVDAIVVMADIAVKRLEKIYGVDSKKVVVIPHGVPDITFNASEQAKKRLNLTDRLVLSTFGLLSEGKGIEYAIEATAKIVKNFPEVLYLVLGETHPVVAKNFGEGYRQKLEKLVKSLKMESHVRFVNRYLNLSELIEYLKATDIYITPYLNPEQITSGTLAYAVGAGKACVSTPYIYAKEILGSQRGKIVPFQDPVKLAETLKDLILDPAKRKRVEKKAYLYGRNMIWHSVSLKYLDLFSLVK